MRYITITIPIDPEYYGVEATARDAERASAALVKLAREFAPREFPGAEVDVVLVPEAVTMSNRSWDSDADDDEEVRDFEDALWEALCANWTLREARRILQQRYAKA